MEATNAKRYFIGLELGRPQDFTAIAIVEQEAGNGNGYGNRYQLRHLERFNVGTPYPAVAEQVSTLMLAPQLKEDSNLLIDATGVALPVANMLSGMLEQAGVKARPSNALITAGDSLVRDYPTHRIPRRDLASTLQAMLQSGRLKIAPQLPHVDLLKSEMANFQVRVRAAGDGVDLLAWREGAADDLVLAAALAVWAGENLFRKLRYY